jgi:CubicO group peptidase (beta-lactamase class C family)
MVSALYFRIVVGISCLLCFACGRQVKDKIVEKEKTIDSLKQKMEQVQARKLELLLEYAHKKQKFNGSVLIASKGEVLIQKSYGIANFQTNVPITSKTIFPIASLTRGFTATAILQLAERSKLRLDDTLGKYYPNFPYKKMRIIDLLWQVSGLPDYLTHFYTPTNQPLTHAYNPNIINWILQEKPKLRFPPQKAFALSSTNYIFLADIIEKVAEMPFAQYLEENIWKPLEMKHTYLKMPKQNINLPKATGYYADLKLADESYVDFVYGDAGIHSTIEDLWKWAKALQTDLILSQTAIEQFNRAGSLENQKRVSYSLGWHLEKGGKAQVLRGNWLGFGAHLWRMPEQNQCFIIFNNNQNAYLPTLADNIYAILQNENVKLE